MLTIIRNNPGAFLLALAIHIALLGALSFSIDWHSPHKLAAPKVNVIQAVMIDESKIRAEEQQKKKIDEQKRQKHEAERKRKLEEKRKKELKKKQDAEKKRQAEVERKRKQEAQRKNQEAKKKRLAEQEQKRKIEAEKKRRIEAERKRKEAEVKRRAEEKRQAEEARQRREKEARRAEEQRLLQEQMAAEEARLNEIRQGELARESDRLIDQIRRRVESKWLKPSGWQPGISCTVNVRLVPGVGGSARVIDARITKSCGQALFDHSVETAVFNASPLPFPSSPELMERFREITFEFKPEE